MPAAAIVGGSLLSSAIGAESADKSADAQSDAADAGIAEQRRQFDQVQELLAPFVDAGDDALGGQLDFLGLNGRGAQQDSINGIAGSPQFRELTRQGENAILQNASATGGLRGGNTQGALAQFRPQVLNQLIDQQYQRLGGLASNGQNAASGVGAAGQNMANNVGNLQQQSGAAQAGNHIAQGNAIQGAIGGIAGGISFGQGLQTPTF